MVKQIRFADETGEMRGGILFMDRAQVICGCCGAVFEVEDVAILDVYEDWVDLSAEIIGN